MSRVAQAASAERALRRGVDRISTLAGPSGWHGFRTLAGDSEVWVSAFVLAAIAPIAPRRAVVRRARAALADAQHASGGWSFGGDVPPDADSTAWALTVLQGTRLLNAAGRQRAGEFLAEHTARDGYATYARDGSIARFIAAGDRSVEGWTSEHPDVTAAVLVAGPPGTGDAERLGRLAALVECQNGAGWWPAYWWRAPQYTTTLVMRALRRHKHSLPSERATRLLHAFAREQLADGGYPLGGSPDADPFVTALALESLSSLQGDEARDLRERAGQALLAMQLADGSWMGDYQLRIPPPDVRDPELVRGWTRGGGGGASFVLDRDGLFATAQACAAIARWLDADRDEPPGPAVPRRQLQEDGVVEALASTSLASA